MQGVFLVGFSTLLVTAVAIWAVQGRQRKAIAYGDVPLYRKRSTFLSRQEKSYYEILEQTVGQYSRIFPKVRLADLIDYPGPHPRFKPHWQRVQRRCVDFLLCTPKGLNPVMAIKLESRADRRRRRHHGVDLLEDTLEIANLPLLRVRASEQYEAVEVAQQIRVALARAQEPMEGWFVEDASVSEEDDESGIARFTRQQLPTFGRWAGDLAGAVRGAVGTRAVN